MARDPAYAQPADLDDRGIDVWLADQARTAPNPQPFVDRLMRRGAISSPCELPDDDHCDWPE